jgi:hypothetical protein
MSWIGDWLYSHPIIPVTALMGVSYLTGRVHQAMGERDEA